MVQQIGLDAVVFLRFVRMCRNMFLVLSLVGIGILVPVNITNYAVDSGGDDDDTKWISEITPLNVWSTAQWSQVVVAWLFDIVIAVFLWWNYRKIVALRRKFFESDEYQNSLHARTLMVRLANRYTGSKLTSIDDRYPQTSLQ